jgi:DNA repair exonuclease SbcCD ATPase subunit
VSDIIAKALQRTIEERNQWRAECQRVTVERDELEARLAEKDETISRMQGLLETCDEVMEVLRTRLTAAGRDAERWRSARRLADEISDPALRGIVTTFLDRFGIAARAGGAGEAGCS